MPFKRKIITPEEPKRSFRNLSNGKRKVRQPVEAKVKKPRTLY
jgi:hypothetical protein